jgi:hypothetical protein
MNFGTEPLLPFLLISLLVAVIAGVLVAQDAKTHRIPINGDTYDLNTGALAWFLSCLILLIATVPYYFYRRSHILATRRSADGATRPPITDINEILRGFAKLRDDGLITVADYEAKKRAVLGLASSPENPLEVSTVKPASAINTSTVVPSRSGAGGYVVLVLLVLGLFLWYVWNQSALPSVPAVPAVQLPTKAEWMQRATTVGVNFLIVNGSIHAPRDALYHVVGAPSSTQLMGDETYLYWDCADGTVQLSVSTGYLALNEVSGKINTY